MKNLLSKLINIILEFFKGFARGFVEEAIEKPRKEKAIKIKNKSLHYMVRKEGESYQDYRDRRKKHGKMLRIKAGRWTRIWNSRYTYERKLQGAIM